MNEGMIEGGVSALGIS